MTEQSKAPLELIARRVLSTAVRATTLEGEALSYRRSLPDAIPGQLISVDERKRWVFRHRTMIGGPLLHVGFSLRALRQAGITLPERQASGALRDVGSEDPRLEEALLQLEDADYLGARVGLLELLEEEPASLVAQAAAGHVHAALRQTVPALAHFTAAVRLGFAALGTTADALDTEGLAEEFLLGALSGRAALLESLGRPEAAASDLRRALRCDPEDSLALGPRLARLTEVSSERTREDSA